jgi:adenylate cyclase
VGRDPVSDLPILDPAVSRRHAELRVDERDALVHVTDLGSRNGTWINNARITRAVLRPGDRIAFGTVAFTAYVAEPTPLRPTPSVPSVDPGATLLRERVAFGTERRSGCDAAA